MPDLAATFGANVRRFRERKGLTQAELAHQIDKSLEWIRRIEKGGTSPSFTTITDLAEALGTKPHHLLDDGLSQPSRLLTIAANNLTEQEIAWLLQGVILLRDLGKTKGKKPLLSRKVARS